MSAEGMTPAQMFRESGWPPILFYLSFLGTGNKMNDLPYEFTITQPLFFVDRYTIQRYAHEYRFRVPLRRGGPSSCCVWTPDVR
jgi:hypothetical protein